MPASPTRLRRRTVLKALTLPALTPLFSTACSRGSKGTVRVAVVWSGWELTAFRQVLAAFTERERWKVSVLSMGNDVGAVIGAGLSEAAAPDVAMLSQPVQVHQYADRLVPITQVAGVRPLLEAYPSGWRKLVQPAGQDGQDLGVWFKAALKSMVWYRNGTATPGASVPVAPHTWDAWQETNQDLASTGTFPLALGGADGWVLCDWLSNVLIGLDPGYYRKLISKDKDASWHNDHTRTALHRLAEMWTQPGAFPNGISGALLTQFEDSVLDVFAREDAAMVAEGDFSYPVISRYGAPGVERAWFPFPAMSAGSSRPVVVGGDVAVLLKPGREGGRALIRWLADPAAARIWASQGGFISVNDSDDSVYRRLGYITGDAVNGLDAVRAVRKGMDDGFIAFSLSDMLGGSDGKGLWKILQEFLARLDGLRSGSDRTGIDPVVDDTVTALVAAR